MPWLDKKKDQQLAAETEDPLAWDKSDEAPGAAGGSSRLPLLAGVLAIIAVTVGVIYMVTRPSDDSPASDEPVAAPPAIFQADLAELARAALGGFLDAQSVEEKLPHVAWPEKVGARMADYYARYPDEVGGLREFQFLSASPQFETQNTYYLAASVDPDGAVRFWVLLAENGQLKIDWECLVAYSPLGITEFVATPPATPTPMRLTAKRTEYYNYGFEDSDFQSYELRGQGAPDEVLYGYAKIGSPLHSELESLIPDEQPVPLHLELAPPPGADR